MGMSHKTCTLKLKGVLTMKELIEKALNKAGYTSEPTEEELIICFMDYVDCGTWSNLTSDDTLDDINLGLITIEQMCNALIRLK